MGEIAVSFGGSGVVPMRLMLPPVQHGRWAIIGQGDDYVHCMPVRRGFREHVGRRLIHRCIGDGVAIGLQLQQGG